MSAVLKTLFGPFAYGTATYSDALSFYELAANAPPPVIDPITKLTDTAALDGLYVAAGVKDAARTLLHLVTNKANPEITIEDSGEISFEWYRDNNHVAVLTVDGQYIRWAAVTGGNPPISAVQPFDNAIPVAALAAIDAAS
jgi:hypothetical protein